MLGRTLFDRYHLEQVLGRSASGTLYLATDLGPGSGASSEVALSAGKNSVGKNSDSRKSDEKNSVDLNKIDAGELLAVKIISLPPGRAEEERLSFRRIAGRLRGLDHPNLLVPREVIEIQGGLCEILPYIPARSLAERLESGPLTLAGGVALIRQLATALGVLHEAGIPHHNLKPRNVLATGEDDPPHWVLGDAGRSLLHGLGGPEEAPEGLGQVRDAADPSENSAYRAPEQGPWLDDAPGFAADWYALGLLAYRALTGAFPYAGATAWEMQRHHVVTPAESPRRHRPDMPPALEAILLKLLAKRPRDRYPHARALLADLDHWQDAALPEVPSEANGFGFPESGQEANGDRLRTALGQATTGRGGLVVLKGKQGMGRKHLLGSLLPDIAAARGLLLRADLPPGERVAPFEAAPFEAAPFEAPLQWFESLLGQWEYLSDLHRRDLLHRLQAEQGHNAAVLCAVHPGLAPLLPPVEALTPLPLGGARHRTLHALCEALMALAEPRRPLVLWLTEAQRCDMDSLALLRLLAHRLADTPVLIVLTINSDEGTGAGRWEERLRSGAEVDAVHVVEVPPLTSGQAARLLAEEGEALGAPPLDAASAQRLAQWACTLWGGCPLALRLGMKLLLNRGMLKEDAQGGMDWPALEAASWPESLDALVAHMVEWLPEETLMVLQALAVTPEGCTFDALHGRLDHLPPAMVLDRVESLTASGWLRRSRGLIRFAHDAFASGVLAQTPPAVIETLHASIGAVMEGESPSLPIVHHHRTALHLEQGGDLSRANEQGYLALAACWEAQAHGGVSFWSARLQPRFGEDARLADLLVTGGIARVQLGHPAAGRSLLESARTLSLNESTDLECIAFGAWAHMEQGDPDAALQLIEEGLALGGETLPAHTVGSVLSRLAGRAAHHYEHLRHKATGAEPTAPTPIEEALMGLFSLASYLLSQSQPARASTADEKIVQIAAGRKPTPTLVRALVRLAEAEGDPEGGFFAEARHLLERHPFPHAEAEYRFSRGKVYLAAGAWSAAREALEAARGGFRKVGDPSGEWRALRERLELDRLQGPSHLLLRGAREALALASLMERPAPLGWSEGFLAYAILMVGNSREDSALEFTERSLEETCAKLREAAESLAELGAGDDGAYLLALSGELALCRGNWSTVLETVRSASGLPGAAMGSGGLLLRRVLTEAHLLQARIFPDEQAHHLRQAHLASKPLLQQREWSARLEPELALCEAMELMLEQDTGKALALIEARLPALDAGGIRLTAGWLRFRLAEALKASDNSIAALKASDNSIAALKASDNPDLDLKGIGDAGSGQGHPSSWLRWGGQALNDFEALGAAPYLAATRALLELTPGGDAHGQDDPLLQPTLGVQPVAVGVDDLWELLAHAGPQEEAHLLGRWLEGLREDFAAEHAQVYRPNGDGQLEGRLHATLDGRMAPPGNRWLVDAVWRDRRAQVVEHYRPSAEADGFGAAQSLLCAPLVSGDQRFGVVLLGVGVDRQVFDASHLARLEGSARRAATALTLNAALSAAQSERKILTEENARREHTLDWTYHAASEEDLPGLLQRFYQEAEAGASGDDACLGALMALRKEDSSQLEFAAGVGNDLPASTWEPWFPLSGGQAALAMERQSPLPVRGSVGEGSTLPPSEAEQRLLNALGAGGGLWLPLVHKGQSFGVVLLAHPSANYPSSQETAGRLAASLRMLMPSALHLHRLAEEQRRNIRERESRNHLVDDQKLLRALLPPGLGDTPADLGEAILRGVERVAPFLVGEVPALAQSSDLNKDELLRTLRFYFERIDRGLGMHRGELANIHHRQWVAHYHGGADSALWGAQTLYQMLLGLREEANDLGIILPPTGLGLHLGNSLWGAMPSGDRLAPFVQGSGVREAARLAAMSISFRCGILVSQALVDGLETPERFDLRHLGKLRPAAGERRVEVYELFSVREETEREPMRSMQPVWEEALRAYRMGRWHNAAGGFNTYIAKLPHDRPARYFLQQCRERTGD